MSEHVRVLNDLKDSNRLPSYIICGFLRLRFLSNGIPPISHLVHLLSRLYTSVSHPESADSLSPRKGVDESAKLTGTVRGEK